MATKPAALPPVPPTLPEVDDPLAPARGVFYALILSVAFWLTGIAAWLLLGGLR